MRDALLGGAALTVPSCDGRRGHPVGFAAHYFDDLLSLQGDAGARSLLERDSSHVVHIKTGDDGILADIDVPGDLRIVSSIRASDVITF